MGKNGWKELFTSEELEWFIALGKAKHDPDEKRVFFEGVVERKRTDPSYSLFQDFPKEAPAEAKKDTLAQRYSQEIIDMLRGRGARTKGERETESA